MANTPKKDDDKRPATSSPQPTHTGRQHPPKAPGTNYFVATGTRSRPATGPEGGPAKDEEE